MSRLTELLRRAERIRQTEGLIPLVRRGLAFARWNIFRYGTYYLYEHTTDNIRYLNEAALMPRVDDFTFEIISTNGEADELEADGLEFRSQAIHARETLDKGAVAFCIFAGRELAHIGWVAMTEEAKKSLDEFPFEVDFSDNKAVTTRVWTKPKYRGMGLMTDGIFIRIKHIFNNSPHHRGS